MHGAMNARTACSRGNNDGNGAWGVRNIIGALLAVVSLPASADTKVSAAAERGEASYYWQARKTASGEPFDPEAMTCAHKTLEFNTSVRVTNLRTGHSVICRVNDRGPFTRGRIIDLSRAGARAIGMIEAGVTQVTLEVLQRDDPSRRSKMLASETSEASQLGEHRSAVPLQ